MERRGRRLGIGTAQALKKANMCAAPKTQDASADSRARQERLSKLQDLVETYSRKVGAGRDGVCACACLLLPTAVRE